MGIDWVCVLRKLADRGCLLLQIENLCVVSVFVKTPRAKRYRVFAKRTQGLDLHYTCTKTATHTHTNLEWLACTDCEGVGLVLLTVELALLKEQSTFIRQCPQCMHC